MPLYVYECQTCGAVHEIEQRITADPLAEMPHPKMVRGKPSKRIVCSGPVKRLIGDGIGAVFKGSGFHVNDYPSKS